MFYNYTQEIQSCCINMMNIHFDIIIYYLKFDICLFIIICIVITKFLNLVTEFP